MTAGFQNACVRIIQSSLIVYFIATVPLFAQDSTGFFHLASLHAGMNQIKDENLHPKVSRGTVLELNYGFEQRNGKDRLHEFQFGIGYSRMRTSREELSKSLNLKLNLAFGTLYPLVKKNRAQYRLGPELSVAYNVCFFPNWDDSHLYWADYASIGIRNRFTYELRNRQQWISTLSIPLFSVFSRPPLYRDYKIDDTDFNGIARNLHSNLTAAHLTNVFFARFQTAYRFPILQNKWETWSYRFDYLRVRHPDGRAFQQITHEIGLTIFL